MQAYAMQRAESGMSSAVKKAVLDLKEVVSGATIENENKKKARLAWAVVLKPRSPWPLKALDATETLMSHKL
jgi:hypothetical protein